MLGTVDLKVKFEARVTKDGDDWVAHCLPLDIYSQSETRQGAVDVLRDAVAGWFESCLERNVLAQALKEVGFRLLQPGEVLPGSAGTLIEVASPAPKQAAFEEEVEISIPAYVAAALTNSSSEYAPC